MTREQALQEAARLKLTYALSSLDIGKAAAQMSIGIKAAQTDAEQAKEKSE